MDDFYKRVKPMTKHILRGQREAIADTTRSKSSDYLRTSLLEEFGEQFPWEVVDGVLNFHANRGKSPFLQNKLYQQNRLEFPIQLHRKAIRNIQKINPKRFLITLRILPKERGWDIHFIVSTSKEHGKLLTKQLETQMMPRNPILKRTTRRKTDILILTLDAHEENPDPNVLVGIDLNVDSIDFAFLSQSGEILTTKKLPTGFRKYFLDWYKKWNRLKQINGEHTSRQMKRLLRVRRTKKRTVLDAAIHLLRTETKGKIPLVRIENLNHVRMKMIPEFPHWVKRSFIYGGQFAQMLENQWQIEEISPRNTSRTCSYCAHVHHKRGDQHIFSCEECGLICDSHLNAAIVIAAGGVKAFQQLKGMHGVTRNIPPPASALLGSGRGLVNKDANISLPRQDTLDEYISRNNFGPYSETREKQRTEVHIEGG